MISPIVITVKKDQSIKLAIDSKVLNKAIHKNKYERPNIEMLNDSISQHLTNTQKAQQAYFSTLDLKFAYSQLQLHENIAKHCNFNIFCGESTGTYRFKTGFYSLIDLPADIQKAMDYILVFKTFIASLMTSLLLVPGLNLTTSVTLLNV